MINDVHAWKHLFKLDPDREISDEALERVCLSGTDGIMVGGSTGVTYDNTAALFQRLKRYSLPVMLEVSALQAVVPGFDAYLIPLVLNTREADWFHGLHIQAIREYGAVMPWDRVLGEGYIILNQNSSAARLTGAYDAGAEDAAAMALYADRLLRLPIVYIEYSGIFGDMALVRRIRSQLQGARLFYGGGIDSRARAAEALEASDTIVVGNALYDDLDEALKTVPKSWDRKESNDERISGA